MCAKKWRDFTAPQTLMTTQGSKVSGWSIAADNAVVASELTPRTPTTVKHERANRLQVNSALPRPMFRKGIVSDLAEAHEITTVQAFRLVNVALDALQSDPYVQAWIVASLVEADRSSQNFPIPHREVVSEIMDKTLLDSEIKEKLLRQVTDLDEERLDEIIIDIFILMVTLAANQ